MGERASREKGKVAFGNPGRKGFTLPGEKRGTPPLTTGEKKRGDPSAERGRGGKGARLTCLPKRGERGPGGPFRKGGEKEFSYEPAFRKKKRKNFVAGEEKGKGRGTSFFLSSDPITEKKKVGGLRRKGKEGKKLLLGGKKKKT